MESGTQRMTPRGLLTALGMSVAAAAAALILFVLPAEYGIDPTGAGEAMGIRGMAGYSVSAVLPQAQAYVEDRVAFELGPFESVEYKYRMEAGAAMLYAWQAEHEVVFDFHSEEDGRDPEDAVSFAVGRSASEFGAYVAPYAGIHGWFWENRGAQTVVVKLSSSGFFSTSTTFSAKGEYTREL